MPELAEVETVCRQIEKHLKGKKIAEVEVDAKDRFLYAFASSSAVEKALKGATIKGTGRKGKYFWIELDRKPWPLLHLGMSGSVAILDPKAKKSKGVWEGAQVYTDPDGRFRDRLWFSRLLARTKDGKEMAVVDPRRFGRLWLTDDPWTHPRIKALGFDPLLKFPTAAELGKLLARRKKTIKSVLLDQALFAGIGNWLADEILFQARLSPHHLAAKLTPAQVRALHKATLKVVNTAVKADGDYERFPKDWLFHERWGKSKKAKTSKGKIIHETVGGRTTAWVPTWQK